MGLDPERRGSLIALRIRFALILFILCAGFLLAVWYTTFPLKSNIEPFELVRKLPVLILAIFILIAVQLVTDDFLGYCLMMTGLTIFFLAQLENFMDEFYRITYFFSPLDIEDFTTVGLLLAGLGIYQWSRLLIRTTREMSQQQKETDLFSTILRHDISNDLQALMGYLDSIQLLDASFSNEAVELLESASEAGRRMSRLVKVFSTIESDEKRVIPLLEEIIEQAKKTHLGIEIQLEAPATIGIINKSGSTLFRYVVENLIRNSYEYCGENPTVFIRVSRIDTAAELMIWDNGPDLPEAVKSQLFKRGITSSGSGLGLYLVKTICEACGGSIEYLEDEKYSGATFRILIPLKIT